VKVLVVWLLHKSKYFVWKMESNQPQLVLPNQFLHKRKAQKDFTSCAFLINYCQKNHRVMAAAGSGLSRFNMSFRLAISHAV